MEEMGLKAYSCFQDPGSVRCENNPGSKQLFDSHKRSLIWTIIQCVKNCIIWNLAAPLASCFIEILWGLKPS